MNSSRKDKADGSPLRVKQDPTKLDFSRLTFKPKLDIEYNDQFKSSTISFKFIAIKTPSVLNQSVQMPHRVQFSTKFFMFRERKAEPVVLRLPKSVARSLKHQNVMQEREANGEDLAQKTLGGSLLKGRQYFLMKYEGLKQSAAKEVKQMWEQQEERAKSQKASQIDEEYLGFSENGLEMVFDFDPSTFLPQSAAYLAATAAGGRPMSAGSEAAQSAQLVADLELEQHRIFCKYLSERVLTIDIWNGDSLMHFGTCRIPLYLLMRQGEPSKVIGQEFDIIESEFAERVGGLQLVVTNHGRTQRKQTAFESASPFKKSHGKETVYGTDQKNKKIVTSNPIESYEIQETLQDKVEKEQIQANKNLNMQMNEDERKRLRVERLKKRGLALGGGVTSDKINDPKSTNWQKREQLKQIQLIREQNKASILQKVSQEARILNQQTISVISGEP